MKRRSGFSSRAGECDAREVTTASEKRDVQGDLGARVALDERHRLSARRSPWPRRSRLEAWGKASGTEPEVDLVGGRAVQGHVRPVVVPGEEECNLATEGRKPQRHEGKHAKAAVLKSAYEPFRQGNASVLADGASTLADATAATPAAEAGACELGAAVGDGDPHSPHLHGSGFWSVLRGLWHAHVGWVFQADPPGLDRYIKDLLQSRVARAVSALTPLWIALSVLLPGLLGGVITQKWGGVWTGLIWGGLVRIFVVHHITWSVNSVCHIWGFRPYRSEDESRNNIVFGVLALGEGYHNTHHAFPTSARHGLRWWQIDVSYYVIRVLAWLGLAWDVKLPSKKAQAKGRRTG